MPEFSAFSATSATAVVYEAIQPTPLTSRTSSIQSFTSKITSKIKHVRTRTSISTPAAKEVAKPTAVEPKEDTPAPKPVVKEATPKPAPKSAPKELTTPKESAEKPRSIKDKDTHATTAIQELESALKKFQAEAQLSKSSAEILKIVDTQCAEITEQLRAAVALPEGSDQQSPKKQTAINAQATVSKLAALNLRRLELLRILERNAISMLNAAHALQHDNTFGCLLSSGTTANVIAELKNAVDHLSKRIFELTFNESTRTDAEQQFEKLRKDAVVLAKLITQNSELDTRLCEAAAAVKSKNPDAVALLTNQLVESRAKESAQKDALKQQMQQLEKQCRQYYLAHVLQSMEHLSKHCHFL